MEIQIASLRWRFTFEDESAESVIRARYAPYSGVANAPPTRTLDLIARTGSLAPGAKQGDSEVTIVRTGDTFTLERLDFSAKIDLSAGRGELAFTGLGGVQSFLRVACAFYLAPEGGVLVHSSSVVRQGRAYVFVGVSGAGKTTIARLSAPSLILSDEVSAIVPVGDGRDGTYACHATPFWGDLADDVDEHGRRVKLREEPASAPLERIFFPRQSAFDSVEPTTRANAFSELMREAFVFGDDDATMGAIAASCGRIAESVPAADLHFRKTPDFWSHILG